MAALHSFGFYLSFFFFLFPLPILSGCRLDVCLSVNLECRSKVCCTRLAENTRREKSPKNRHLHTIAQLCRAISSQLRHISTIGKKNLLSSNMSSTCPHNMVNFGPLAAEIGSGVWGTPTHFNGFCVLAALLRGRQVVSVSQTLRVEQRVPPMFGSATIRLGIGPHCSSVLSTSTSFPYSPVGNVPVRPSNDI